MVLSLMIHETWCKAGSGSQISTENTEFVFLNPTNLTLTLEYAFLGWYAFFGTKLIHASFIFIDLSERDQRLTPRRFYGHSCQGEPVPPGLARKEPS